MTVNGFDGTYLPIQTGTFSQSQFSGYVVSGNTYTSEICFGVNCKAINVYGVNQISQNNLNFNEQATYGIIGMGPNSYIWEAFVDPETLISTYSIALARPNIFGMEGADQVQSNITFGGANA